MNHIIFLVTNSCILLLGILLPTSFGFTLPTTYHLYYPTNNSLVLYNKNKNDDDILNNIDRQSDSNKYGRGVDHISADLKEGDVIAYQAGTWYIDGLSEVGDGSPSFVRYMVVDTIQLIWTHDCEHGVINGYDLLVEDASNEDQIVEMKSKFIPRDEYLQIGPEQILAKIPTHHLHDNDTSRLGWLSMSNFLPKEEMTAPS